MVRMKKAAMDRNAQHRYARHISLPEIGADGQEVLLQSRVLVVGAGGLGSPLLLYLAAAGVGAIGVVDDDRVALNNLQRQILHETADVGRAKTASAADALKDLNPDITVIPHPVRLDDTNSAELIRAYDLIADGCDNFQTRFLLNRECLKQGKTLVSAAVMGFAGQLSTFKPYLGAPHPCYQCLHPELPLPEVTPSCNEAGVLGSVAGQMGAWQTTEVIKELLGVGSSLSGYLLLLDGLNASVRKVKLPRDPACPCCAAGNA